MAAIFLKVHLTDSVRMSDVATTTVPPPKSANMASQWLCLLQRPPLGD